jgi:hypothetical protein
MCFTFIIYGVLNGENSYVSKKYVSASTLPFETELTNQTAVAMYLPTRKGTILISPHIKCRLNVKWLQR